MSEAKTRMDDAVNMTSQRVNNDTRAYDVTIQRSGEKLGQMRVLVMRNIRPPKKRVAVAP